jgi:hypothetical protein
VTSCYFSSNPSSEKSIYNLQWILSETFKDGHEMGNHSWNHTTFTGTSFEEWSSQMKRCNDDMVKPPPPDSTVGLLGFDFSFGPGVKNGTIVGFRTPFLRCNDNTFKALQAGAFKYDCSLEEGYQSDQDGKDFLWPYTLDEGSPGNDYLVQQGSEKMPIGKWPGLWEMPAYAVVMPADGDCRRYGIAPGLRKKVAEYCGVEVARVERVTGLDYNLWLDNANGGVHLTKEQFVAVLKNTLDLRLTGNRAPLLFGAHSDMYNTEYQRLHGSKMAASLAQRQQAVEEFIKYALSKPEVRVVPHKDIIAWLRKPVPLGGTGAGKKVSHHIVNSLHMKVSGKTVQIVSEDLRYGSVMQVSLFDVNGRLVIQNKMPVSNVMRWDLGSIVKSGIYVVRVKMTQKEYRGTMVIQ